MFEHKHHEILPAHKFIGRFAIFCAFAAAIGAFALGIGMLGYHYIAGLSWLDALLNASMILTGMGPVDRMDTVGSKLFASAYALFSGVVFLSATGIILAPVFHRIMHIIHLDEVDKQP